MNKISNIWHYFTELGKNKAKCNICEKIYSRTGRATSGLILHLKLQHTEEYSEYSKKKKTKKKQLGNGHQPMQQPTIPEAIELNDFWHSSHPKTKEFHMLISQMIALDYLPFNFVENVGFRRFIKRALPRYDLKGREYYTQLICEDLFEKVKNKIKLILNTLQYLSFTTDIWSDPSCGVALLSLTAHGVSEEMERVNIVLKCCPLTGSHTGDIISTKIEEMLNEWNLNKKIHCFVHDQGTNVVCAMGILNSGHIVVPSVVHKNTIFGFIKHSILAQDDLKKIQTETLGQPQLMVVQDCPTRWNSTYYMFERLLKIKDSIVLYLSKNNKHTISSDDWTIMERCVKILTPFEEITREFSSSSCIVSSVIPLLCILKTSLENIKEEINCENFKNLIQCIVRTIDSKFIDLKSNNIYTIATFFDPRYKVKFFTDLEQKHVKHTILNIFSDSNSNICSYVEDKQPHIQKKPSNHSSNLQSLLENILDSDDEDMNESFESSSLNNFEAMLMDLTKAKIIKSLDNPLVWWKDNKLKYKMLLPLVRKFLSCPPGSVASEQLFSGAGLIYEPLRNRLHPNKAAKLLFLKYNLPVINFDTN